MIAVEQGAVRPAAPFDLEGTGLNPELVLELAAKMLLMSGELSGSELASRLGVRFSVIDRSLELLRREHHCEISGGGLVGAPAYRYRLTGAGRERASLFLESNPYVGPLPVPIEQYRAYMRRFAVEDHVLVTRTAVRRAFAHLVLSDRLLDKLGPAITARHSLFVYGPPGNGKTVIAQAVRNILGGEIDIPHAISIDSHIVRVFDPVNHEPVERDAIEDAGLDSESQDDGRWIRCRRPMVTVGGELTLDALELGRAGKGYYRAPLQVLANGGVLVIDDFGRQHASPVDLLNRWIVPLESRVDHLTLETGQKFELPFNVLVVFATNLRPAELVDEAFLRRIQYKVFAESPTTEQFRQIFENYCRERSLAYDPSLVEALFETELTPRRINLRGCHPRDLIEHALSLASYLGRPRELALDLLQAACDGYFVDETERTLI